MKFEKKNGEKKIIIFSSYQHSTEMEKYYVWNGLKIIYYIQPWPPTPPNSEIICGQNVGTKVVCGMILFFQKKAMLKIWKKS